MSLKMQQEHKNFCPMTPDRVRTSDCGLELFHGGGEFAAAPTGSPVCARSCYTPIRQLPLNTPASCNAPMTGCSGASLATPARGVATPMRASRRCSVTAPTEEEEEPKALIPRALNLCDCGHCAACATEASTQSSLARVKPMRLSDLAGPSPASPGQSPSEGDIPVALTLGASSFLPHAGLTQEILLCGSPSSVRDPRKRPRHVSLPILVIPIIPIGIACTDEEPGASTQKVSDPRLKYFANDLGPDAELLRTAAGYKRRRSSALMLAPPQSPRSAAHVASCRTRRYRSPTPGPEHSQPCSRGSRYRYRSPTPVPSCDQCSEPDGDQH